MEKTTKWILDPTHSEIQFKVKHLMISTVTGQFKKVEGSLNTIDKDFTTAQANIEIDVSSIDTNNQQRDEHLRTNDFFDIQNHPYIRFISTGIQQINDEEFEVVGVLNMRGVDKEIVMNAELGGIVKDMAGNEKVGFSLTGKVNRKDFGVSWNMLTEAGGLTLGEEVKLFINVQFVKQS